MNIALTIGCTISLILSASAPAQSSHLPSSQQYQPTTPAAPYGVGESAGATWGLGGNCIARFAQGQVELTPALGRAAPRTMPMTLTATAVGRHGDLQALAGGVVPTADKQAVDYRHSPALTERYVVREDGIKQSFLFASRPQGSGDLVVRLDVSTELECATTSDSKTLTFAASSFGGMRIGEVIGIDAAGQRATGHLAFDGRFLDLVLPQQFVDSAAYPLELDPLISGFANTGVSSDDRNPDVAYDRDNDVYLVVFEFPISATDVDVWGQFINGDRTRRGNAIPIASGTSVQLHPAVCNCNIIDDFFVCWQDDVAGNWDIRGASVDAATGAVSATMDVAATSADEVTPDVGGESEDVFGTDFGDAICVWDDTALGIRSGIVHVHTSPPLMTGVNTVVGGPDPFRNNPAITKSGGASRRYIIAYQHDTQFISASAVNIFGQVISTPQTLAFSANDLVNHPDIDGDGDSFTMVYERDEAAAPGVRDVHMSHGFYDVANGRVAFLGGAPLDTTQTDHNRNPKIAFLGPMYVATYEDDGQGFFEVKCQNIVPGSVTTCGSRALISDPGRDQLMPAVCSERSGGADSSDALISYRSLNRTSGVSLLRSSGYTAFGGGAVNQLAAAPGCGSGAGTCATDGPCALGNSDFAITLSGADPAANLSIMIADVLGQPIRQSCNGACPRIASLATFFVPLSGGQNRFVLGLPCDPSFLGINIDAQWVVISTMAGGCPQIPDLHFSNAIRMTVAD